MTDPKDIAVVNLAKPDTKAEQLAAVASAMNIEQERDADDESEHKSTTPPAEPPKTPRKHPSSLVRLALKFGASREAIDQASTSDLAEWIEEQEIERDRRQQAALQDRDEQVRTPPRAAKPPNSEPDEIDWGTDELGHPITEDQILPGLRNVIKAQHKKIKELEGGQKKIAERERERSVSTSFERIEDAFASLPQKLQKLFGAGTLNECTNEEKMRRNAVLGAAGIDFGKVPPARVIAQKIAAVAPGLFNLTDATRQSNADNNPYEALAENASPNMVTPTLNGKKRLTEQDMENGTLSRVTHRQTEEPKGRKLAAQKVAQRMREAGMSTSEFDSFDMDDMA